MFCVYTCFTILLEYCQLRSWRSARDIIRRSQFSPAGVKSDLPARLQAISNVPVDNEDSLPYFICKVCM